MWSVTASNRASDSSRNRQSFGTNRSAGPRNRQSTVTSNTRSEGPRCETDVLRHSTSPAQEPAKVLAMPSTTSENDDRLVPTGANPAAPSG